MPLKQRRWPIALSVLAAICGYANSRLAAEVIQFGGNLHGLTGLAAGQLNSGAFQMSLAAYPLGAVLNENNGQALGVDSRGIAGAVDTGNLAGIDKLNLLGGPPGIAGTPESVTFSFNQDGVLRGLKFDGVKDENLEYVRLEMPNGDVLAIFDFEVPLRLTQQGFTVAALDVSNALFLDDERDDIHGLSIPFQPGQTFTLSYGEAPLPPGYVPRQNELPNGIRWQGLVIVPEPHAAPLASGVLVLAIRRSPMRRRRPR